MPATASPAESADALSPSQLTAYAGLTAYPGLSSVYVLAAESGRGRTTLLRACQQDTGGTLLTATDLIGSLEQQHDPLAVEEAFFGLLRSALAANPVVIVDDLHLLYEVACGCSGFTAYPRKGLFEVPLTALAALAREQGKTLVFGCDGTVPGPLRATGFVVGIEDFKAADYAHLCGRFLGGAAGKTPAVLDYDRIYRFAPKLNAHQLRAACLYLREAGKLNTEDFIEHLRSQRMASNVALDEVEAVDLHTLKGIDDIIESLEANLIVPLEDDALAAELNIKPKRGVLLAGPPGTGKTTVGRALAHRLRSKFFLIDGTFISGTRNFYGQVHQVFEAAKQNAPSIIFIDDSDVIFESGQEMGLYRYLLTMLDGLESESAGRVCVMLTAMDVGKLPPALLRSGRVELWLETRLPDADARAAILAGHFAGLPPAFAGVDQGAVVEATDGLTGADLKRLVEDGKLLLAYDRSRGLLPSEPTAYFLRAIETVRLNKERYARAEAYAAAQQKARPSYFDVFASMAAMEMEEGE